LKGQRFNKIEHNKAMQRVIVHCNRDKRFKAVDPQTKKEGTVKQYIRRQVRDVPFMGLPCVLNIERAQARSDTKKRRIETCEFVDKSSRYTKRFCRLVIGLYRHMSIQAGARHLNIPWDTVKNRPIDYI
jgi:transposase